MPKKIRNLVIGSEGFVGNYLCAFLEKKGEEAIRFDITRSEKEDARTATLPLKGIDRVYFLAWAVGGAKYLYREDTQLHQLNWNIDIMKNVMPQLQKSGIPFIFVSSQLAEETDTIYGVTKKTGELWTRQIKGCCVRLWNVYGAWEEMTEKSHVTGDFVHQAITKGEICMMTNGEEKRQFVHIQDVCEGLYHVLSNNLNTAVYDLTSFEWSSVMDIATCIASYLKIKVTPGTKEGAARTIIAIKGNPPGWNHKINLKTGIEMMVKEAKAHAKK